MKRVLVLAVVSCAWLPAAELAVRDLRLGVSTRPSDFDFTLTTSTTHTSGADAFDGGLSVEGGVRWSFARTGDSLGLVVGADLALDGQTYDGGDGLSTAWAKGSLGLGWAATDRLTVLGEGLAGYGLSRLALPATAAAPAFSADGTGVGYEGRLTATWQATRTLNVGTMAGWLIASHDLSGDDSDITVDQSGWYVGLLLSWRISDVPQPLE